MKALHYQTQKEQSNLEERLTQEEVCQYFTGKIILTAEPPCSEKKSLLLGPLGSHPAVCWMSRNVLGGTLRDIQKTAAWETIGPLAVKNFPRTRTIEPARRLVRHCFRF